MFQAIAVETNGSRTPESATSVQIDKWTINWQLEVFSKLKMKFLLSPIHANYPRNIAAQDWSN